MCSRPGAADSDRENSCLKLKGQTLSQGGPQRPQFREGALVERRAQISGAGRAAGAGLHADDALDGQDVLVAPGGECVIDIDQLFGELVELKPTLGILVDGEPGSGSCPLQRGIGLVPQAWIVHRLDQPGVAGAAAFVEVEKLRVFDSETVFELAKLGGLETGGRSQ